MSVLTDKHILFILLNRLAVITVCMYYFGIGGKMIIDLSVHYETTSANYKVELTQTEIELYFIAGIMKWTTCAVFLCYAVKNYINDRELEYNSREFLYILLISNIVMLYDDNKLFMLEFCNALVLCFLLILQNVSKNLLETYLYEKNKRAAQRTQNIDVMPSIDELNSIESQL